MDFMNQLSVTGRWTSLCLTVWTLTFMCLLMFFQSADVLCVTSCSSCLWWQTTSWILHDMCTLISLALFRYVFSDVGLVRPAVWCSERWSQIVSVGLCVDQSFADSLLLWIMCLCLSDRQFSLLGLYYITRASQSYCFRHVVTHLCPLM